MRITKFGHCCLLVEENGVRILIDPGIWSEGFIDLEHIDALLITHEHPDHFDIEAIKHILAQNKKCTVFTNTSVQKKLQEINMSSDVLIVGKTISIQGVLVQAINCPHEEIYPTIVCPENIGYWIGEKLFYPGDNVSVIPDFSVDVLALPVIAPWMKLADAIDYGKKIKPRICFPVHDGMLKHTGPYHIQPKNFLTPLGIDVVLPNQAVSFDV